MVALRSREDKRVPISLLEKSVYLSYILGKIVGNVKAYSRIITHMLQDVPGLNFYRIQP
jgi:hypothetical protein